MIISRAGKSAYGFLRRLASAALLGGAVSILIVSPAFYPFWHSNPELRAGFWQSLLVGFAILACYGVQGTYAGALGFAGVAFVSKFWRRIPAPVVTRAVVPWLASGAYWVLWRHLRQPYTQSSSNDRLGLLVGLLSIGLPTAFCWYALQPRRKNAACALIISQLLCSNGYSIVCTPAIPATAPLTSASRLPHPQPTASKLWLLGIDGLSWSILIPLIRSDRIPTFQALLDHGVSIPMTSLRPMLSPSIWTSVASGKIPEKHGIYDFVVRQAWGGTAPIRVFPPALCLAQESGLFKIVPVTSGMRRVSALWSICTETGLSSITVGWWATWPAEKVKGIMLSRIDGTIQHDAASRNRSAAYPVSLLDQMQPFLRQPLDMAPKDLDLFVSENKARSVDADLMRPRSLLRLAWSSTVSRFAVTQYLAAKYDPMVMMSYFPGIDYVSHFFWRDYEPDRFITGKSFPTARSTIIPRFYQFVDRLLGTLTREASEQTDLMIMSDHGFGPAVANDENYFIYKRFPEHSGTHRPQAVWMAAGPRFAKSQRLLGQHHASVLDITPTVLTLLGLPQSRDMDGISLIPPALDRAGEQRDMPTYDTASRDGAFDFSSADDEALGRLQQLGYLK